jgi:hypothetical protein
MYNENVSDVETSERGLSLTGKQRAVWVHAGLRSEELSSNRYSVQLAAFEA